MSNVPPLFPCSSSSPQAAAPGSGDLLRDQILCSTRDCIQILTLDGTLRWMNTQGQERLAIGDIGSVAGMSWIDFWAAQDQPTVTAAIALARSGAHGRFEGCFRTLRGEQTWWDVSVTAMLGDDGQPEALLAVSREITSRHWAEAELARKSRQLEMIVDRAPALIAYVDADQRYQWVNCGYENWYGLKPSEAVGRYWYEVLEEKVGRDYVDQLRPRVEEVLAGTAVTFEAVNHAGGRRHDMVLSYAPDRDKQGQVRGFVLVVTDQTEQRRAQQELRASEERFRTLAEALPSIVWTTTPGGEIDYLSDRFRERTGRAAAEGIGTAWTQVIHPDDLPGVLQRWKSSIESGTLFETQYRVLQHDGTYRWHLARGLPQRKESGEILRWVGVATDIHRQVSAEEAVRERERRYRLLFEDNPLPMWTYDCETLQVTSVNDMALRGYGYSREEFLSMRVTELRPAEDVPGFLEMIRTPEDSRPDRPTRHKRKDGTVFWAQVTGHESSEGQRRTRLVVAQDVTERVLLHEELQRRAGHDALTGLPNRTLLADRYAQAVSRAERSGHKVGLLVIDFDRFKQVNDTFGHEIGDEFLKAATNRLQSVLRKSDFLARVGGDELVVIADELPSTDHLTHVVERLMRALEEPLVVRDIQLQSTVSAGLAICPDDGHMLDDLLRRADYGLYEAKRAGRNCWKWCVQSKGGGVEEALSIERSLRCAFKEGRLLLHYQPIFSRDGKVKAVEALLRLTDPQLGLLPPGRFIPIAEESGLIHALGVWVLREVCGQCRRWRDEGFEPVPVAINVSATQFLRGNLVEEIRRALEDFDVEPGLLELELTESLLMENTQQARQQLLTLKEIGIRIAIDDFGTGYSSLSYLHALPLDTLKIDRSFVQKILGQASNPIVTTILELGRNLGLNIVAEGVETEEQYQELARLGCDLLQGYLLGRPQPAAAMRRLLARGLDPSAQAGQMAKQGSRAGAELQ